MATLKFQSTLPMLIYFFVVGMLKYAGVNLDNGFVFGLVLATGWFVLIPLLVEIGVGDKSLIWFKRAGLFALFISVFGLVIGTFLAIGVWHTLLAEIALLLSALFGLIGVLFALLKVK